MPYGNLALDTITTSTGQTFGASSASTMKNRIINGDMRIDQRNGGASITTSALQSNTYFLDRWYYYNDAASKLSIQQVADAPAGFYNSLKATVIATDATGPEQLIRHKIEGYNIVDLAWGTVNAKTCTFSFWVKSSVTGQMGGSICSSNLDNCYPFAYTVNQGNTWEYKTVTVTGPTSGTFTSTNAVGIVLGFELGVGFQKQPANTWWPGNSTTSNGSVNLCATNGATWQVTGVQLEVGAAATTFDYRNYQTELALCQRYFSTTYTQGVALGTASQPNARTAYAFDASTLTRSWFVNCNFPVTMRTIPTVTIYDQASGTVGNVREYSSAVSRVVSSINNGGQSGDQGLFGYMLLATNGNQIPQQFHLACSSEL